MNPFPTASTTCRRVAFGAALLLASCQSAKVAFPDLGHPVVLGNRLNIGPTSDLPVEQLPLTYESLTYSGHAAASANSIEQYGGTYYQVSTTSTSSASYDDTAHNASLLLSDNPRRAIRGCRVEAYTWLLNCLFFLSGEGGFRLEGDVVEQPPSTPDVVAASGKE